MQTIVFSTLRKKLKAVDKCFVIDKISERDVLEGGEKLEKKIERAMEIESSQERILRCASAGSVFQEFAKDAAARKVHEMEHAQYSGDRQRAQETIIEYAMGKPINRMMSLSMKIPDAPEEELDHDIRRLMAELGYSTRQGKTTSILIGNEGDQSDLQTVEARSQPRISEEVHPESKKD